MCLWADITTFNLNPSVCSGRTMPYKRTSMKPKNSSLLSYQSGKHLRVRSKISSCSSCDNNSIQQNDLIRTGRSRIITFVVIICFPQIAFSMLRGLFQSSNRNQVVMKVSAIANQFQLVWPSRKRATSWVDWYLSQATIKTSSTTSSIISSRLHWTSGEINNYFVVESRHAPWGFNFIKSRSTWLHVKCRDTVHPSWTGTPGVCGCYFLEILCGSKCWRYSPKVFAKISSAFWEAEGNSTSESSARGESGQL